MYYINRFIILLLLVLSQNLNSQDDFEGFGESAFSVNHYVNSDYKVNFSLRSRYYLYQEDNFNFENRQLDFVHFSTYSLDFNHKVSLGIQYRFRESIDGESDELRLTQQFNFTKINEALRFGHRIRFEQRFFENETVFRSRYRFALDFPLNGEKLDIGESYLLTGMEALFSFRKGLKSNIDHRTMAQLGWLLSKNLKFQLGLEYRFDAINKNTEEKLFLLSSLILKV